MASERQRRKARRRRRDAHGGGAAPPPAPPRERERDRERRRPGVRGGDLAVRESFRLFGRGERPRPPWHPIPVSEIAVAGGVAAVALALARGPADGKVTLDIGVLVCLLGIGEIVAREHFSGFRSHTLLLAFLPVVALQTSIVLLVDPGWRGLRAIAVDAVLFAALAYSLQRMYAAASRPRRTQRR